MFEGWTYNDNGPCNLGCRGTVHCLTLPAPTEIEKPYIWENGAEYIWYCPYEGCEAKIAVIPTKKINRQRHENV